MMQLDENSRPYHRGAARGLCCATTGISAGTTETNLMLIPSQLLRTSHAAAITIRRICYSCS